MERYGKVWKGMERYGKVRKGTEMSCKVIHKVERYVRKVCTVG